MFKVYGDIASSRDFPYKLLGNTNSLFVLLGIDPSKFNALSPQIIGDDFSYIFHNIVDAISFAFCVQETCKYFDWHAHGYSRGPQYRISIIESDFDLDPQGVYVGSGHALGVELCKKTIAGNISIGPIASSKVPFDKYLIIESEELNFISSDTLHTDNGYLYRIEVGNVLLKGIAFPLYDQQRIERENALRRFAYSWLILDQLPRGSWGRSVAPWMKGVWKDLTNISVNPLMEEEGGFETTILNMDIICTILGFEDFFDFYWNSSLDYLLNCQGFNGHFGPTSMSRQGLELATHARHTALAIWFLGKHIFMTDIDCQDAFFRGLKALFLTSDISSLLSNKNERNPVLLYMVCCEIITIIKADTFRNSIINKENEILIDQIISDWYKKDNSCISTILSPYYFRDGVKVNIFPYTSPYGGFKHLEMYSFLTACHFISDEVDPRVKRRIRSGLESLLKTYFKKFDFEDFYTERYTIDSLHTKIRGLPTTKEGGPANLGTISLLLAVLRNDKIVEVLWGEKLSDEISLFLNKAKFYLHEDLVDQFDRYLINPSLFDCVNAGMFASFLLGDNNKYLRRTLKSVLSFQFPTETLPDKPYDLIKSINSELEILKFIKSRIVTNKKCQVASISIERLLLYFNNPGRYHQLEEHDVVPVSESTLDVYREKQFVEKFASKWNAIGDIFPPFLKKLKKNSNVLDLGCGSGQYSLELLKHGHNVTILDGSDEMLSCAIDRISAGGYTIDKEDVFRINILNESNWANILSKKYDAIWCSGLFAHIPVSSQGKVLNGISSLLKENGRLFLNIMIKNPRVVAYDGRYYAYNTSAEEFCSKLKKKRLNISHYTATTISKNTYDEPHIENQWINYYVQKQDFVNKQINKSILTAHAYQRSVSDFIIAHIKKNPNDRSVLINSILSELSEFINEYQENESTLNDISVLDAGCGPGDYVKAMAEEFNWMSSGIDISNKMIEYAMSINSDKKHLINYQIGDISELHEIYRQKQFNAIISVTVFQHLHVEKAIEVLSSFHQVLKKNGIVRIDVQFNRHSGYDPDLRFIEHYSGESDVMSKINFEKIGFEIIKIEPWKLEKKKNTFERPIEFQFCNFWLKKI